MSENTDVIIILTEKGSRSRSRLQDEAINHFAAIYSIDVKIKNHLFDRSHHCYYLFLSLGS